MQKKLSLIVTIAFILVTPHLSFAVDFNDDISIDFLLGSNTPKKQPAKKKPTPAPKKENSDLDLDFGLDEEVPAAQTAPGKKEDSSLSEPQTTPQAPNPPQASEKKATPKKAAFVPTTDLVTKVKKGLPFTIEETEYWVAENPDVNQCLDNGQTMLIYLVTRYKDAESVAFLLENGADLKTHCTPQYDALFMAALNNSSPEVLDTLISNGANLIAKDEDGNTALHLAAAFNPNPNIITTLIDNGLSPETQNRFGQTPLHLSAFNNKNLKITRTLLDYGANPNQADTLSRTPLMAAAIADNAEMIKYLISRGADLNRLDANNLSVLDYHNKTAYLKKGEFQKKTFPTISSKLNTAFDFITSEHHKFNTLLTQSTNTQNPALTADIAIKNHADIDILDKNGCTTLLNALKTQAPASLIKKLLDAGANPNLTCQNNTTALIFTAQNASSAPTEAGKKATLLLASDANPNEPDASDKTALMYGLASPEFIQTLITAGVDLNLKDHAGETALSYALKQNAPEDTVIALITAGADLDLKDNAGETPLSYALKHRLSSNIIFALINATANLNTPLPNTAGDTPLLFAVKNDLSSDIVKQMLKKGADPKIADQNGLNTYDILKNNRYFNAALKNKTRKDNLGSF
ncbi:MAG: ankyrin repeat domain-containing protein [Alphaproteobacteria bacterium]|nr:ankyrin repeat domain-containing protein [Alphaproteobacteria bacterium]